MGEIYKFTVNNSSYWDCINRNGKKSFDRIKLPFHLYLEKTTPFITDKMICNYKDASGIKYLWCSNELGTRLRELKYFVVIEPSGILVPKEDIKLIENKDEIMNDKSIDISDATRTSYFCNVISDLTRGGRDTIPYDEVSNFRDKLFNQSSETNNSSFLTPFEFAYLFTKVCHKKGKDCLNYYEIISDVAENLSSKPEYLPLLWNVEFEEGEHLIKSDSLFNAFALLRYIGIIHPNYNYNEYYQYDDLVIDENIDKFPILINGKESFLPLMEELVNDYLGISDSKEKEKTIRKILK